MEKILFIPDCHHPYADKTAWKLLLKAAKVWKPDRIIVLGDFADFYAVSFHDKDPGRVSCLDYEINEVAKRLDELEKIGAKKLIYIAGNHEYRLERYLMTKAPELFNVVRFEKLLSLRNRGWEFVPYKRHYKLGKLYVTHDCGHAGMNSTRQSQRAYGHNVVIGHNHRMDYHVSRDLTGNAHVAASFGWLGDFSKVDYMHEAKLSGWAHGFGLGYKQPNGHVHLVPVPIVKDRAIIEGKLIRL